MASLNQALSLSPPSFSWLFFLSQSFLLLDCGLLSQPLPLEWPQVSLRHHRGQVHWWRPWNSLCPGKAFKGLLASLLSFDMISVHFSYCYWIDWFRSRQACHWFWVWYSSLTSGLSVVGYRAAVFLSAWAYQDGTQVHTYLHSARGACQ